MVMDMEIPRLFECASCSGPELTGDHYALSNGPPPLAERPIFPARSAGEIVCFVCCIVVTPVSAIACGAIRLAFRIDFLP
jgi:hypothetical protein